MRTRLLLFFLLILIAVLPGSASVKSSIPDAARLHLPMKKLAVVGNALYVGAHPDDENTAVLSTLSLGRMVRAAYLALNRGEGGQNLIGTEQGDLLGVIRTQELLAARGVDNAEQFFTRAVDFGFSKTAEESLSFWGKDEVLGDVVWVYRKFRPDVVITRFPSQGETHGHHIASARLAEEAFVAAGDPNRFPEQLKHVTVWKPKRIVWNRYSWGNQPITEEEKKSLAVLDVGEYSRPLGKSYSELAGISRSMHKSQGFGDSEDRGTLLQYFKHTAGDPAQKDLFEGIDLTWNRIPNGAEIGKLLEDAARNFDSNEPERSIPVLLNAYTKIEKIRNNPWVEEKKRDLLEVVRGCAGLWLEAIPSEESAAPGNPISIQATAINRSSIGIRLNSIRVSPTNNVEQTAGDLPYNQPVSRKLDVTIPSNTSYSQPYWLADSQSSNHRFMAPAIANGEGYRGLPEGPPALQIEFNVSFGNAPGTPLTFVEPVLYRNVDPVRGEVYRNFVVVPQIALTLQDPVAVFAGTVSKSLRVQAISGSANTQGTVRLVVPDGWNVEPDSHAVSFSSKNEAKILTFQVRPANGARSGEFRAEATVGTEKISRGKFTIDYPHIPPQTVFPASKGRLVRVDLKTAGRKVGYVVGPGDPIPEALKQVGYEVTLLSDDDLTARDLSAYDAILIGIRAYNKRTALKDANDRLLQYVNNGGTLIVQYQTAQDLVTSNLGPYPFKISRRRISVEDAPVKIHGPEHSLMTFPNRIEQADFEGWVQERGLYFPDQWDPQYQTMLTSSDPGEEPLPGGILYAEYGKGVYIYTSYSWFRELPAGVPGAYRIFVNLISAGFAD